MSLYLVLLTKQPLLCRVPAAPESVFVYWVVEYSGGFAQNKTFIHFYSSTHCHGLTRLAISQTLKPTQVWKEVTGENTRVEKSPLSRQILGTFLLWATN